MQEIFRKLDAMLFNFLEVNVLRLSPREIVVGLKCAVLFLKILGFR